MDQVTKKLVAVVSKKSGKGSVAVKPFQVSYLLFCQLSFEMLSDILVLFTACDVIIMVSNCICYVIFVCVVKSVHYSKLFYCTFSFVTAE